jgi:hypothetical protein
MKLWTEERLRRFASNEFNRCTRQYPSIHFLMTFACVVLGITVLEDCGFHTSSIWMKYWGGVVAGISSVFEQKRIWKKVNMMEAANTASHGTLASSRP